MGRQAGDQLEAVGAIIVKVKMFDRGWTCNSVCAEGWRWGRAGCDDDDALALLTAWLATGREREKKE